MISSHVLDTALGCPAPGVAIHLERLEFEGRWVSIGEGLTDEDGRVGDLTGGAALGAGTYRLSFAVDAYFHASQRSSFFPHVDVSFRLTGETARLHIPLLLSPFGYSTYRGS